MATILYVDHNEEAQAFIQLTLGRQYNVISATDGPTAMQYCAMIQPDLILIDASQPEIDVPELILRLKMFMPQTPLLTLVDELHPSPQPASPQNGGVDSYLAKPVSRQELRRVIRSFLPDPLKTPQISPVCGVPEDKLVEQFEAQINAVNQANKRLASLNAISALIGTSLDLDHLTDQILHQIQRTIEFDSATLFLLKGTILEAAASRGLFNHRQGMNIFTKNDQNSAWRVVNNKLPLIIGDVTKSDFWEPRPELSQVRSWLGVPLIYKDRVVGVLTLDNNKPDKYVDADARYLFTLAYQIAIAVENAQLFEEWENQATRLKLINEMAQEISTILDAPGLFNALARAIFERLDYDRVAILEVDPSRSFLMLKAYHSKFPLSLKVGEYKQSIDAGLIGEAVRTGRTLFVPDIFQEDKAIILEGTHIHSELIAPVLVGNQIEAIINIGKNEINGFSDHDLWTLSSLAGQAAAVIENAQLYQHIDAYSEKLERIVAARTQRLQAIKKISQIVSQSLGVDSLLDIVGESISQIFSPETSEDYIKVTVALINGSNLMVQVIYDIPQAGRNFRKESSTVCKIDYTSIVGQVIDQSRPVVVGNLDPQNIYSPTGSLGTFNNSLMVAPLITGGKTIGIIAVESRISEAFDESDLETLEALAFQVASAIENARLLQKTRDLAIVDERTRLAREMHDGVAQNLAYLLIQVDRCLNIVEEGSKLEAQLENIGYLLKDNIDELRRNIFDLRPIDLEGKSLFEVLENFVAEFGRRWNLYTSCSVSGKAIEVPTAVESSLYRILQETLSNARQHAHCTRISVRLAVIDDQWITLEIKDDGRGFDVNQPHQSSRTRKTNGLGLISMRERAESVNGELIIESNVGQGTRVFTFLPLGHNPGSDQFQKEGYL